MTVSLQPSIIIVAVTAELLSLIKVPGASSVLSGRRLLRAADETRASAPHEMRTLQTILLSVAIGAIALGGLRALSGFNGEAISIALAGRTDLLVEKDRTPWSSLIGIPADGHGEYLKLTNIGRSAITVRNVLINDMEHCAKLGDVSKFELPLTLPDLGGWATLRDVCPGAIAKVTVETSHGSTTYSWKVAAGMVEE
jgi:hypothetical protein